jgi:hypothetical protein
MTPLPVIAKGPAMPVMVDRLYLIVRVTWLPVLHASVLNVTSEVGMVVLTDAAAFFAAVLAPGWIVGDCHDPDAVAGCVGEGDLGVVGAAEFDGAQNKH